MKKTINNLTKGIAFLVLTFFIVSCDKKNDDAANLSLNNETAVVDPVNSVVVTGNYGNPASGPAVFGTVYLNLSTGATNTTGTGTWHVRFTSTNNSTIFPASGYTLKYLPNYTGDLADIDLSHYNAATTVSSLGRNTSTTSTPNGWWGYNETTHVVEKVNNVVLFASNGTTTYAFQATNAVGEGTATNNRGVYTFNYGIVE
ncbi:hypothetical protein [Olivibacter domesticus]|uniref:HmuY protein n=1 Tax=Olivibacter domesticus TaxID=407022 RepID=A0A1H7W429_OLID1|nr:hypothetical protein [Olivibacter domesticus]SEM16293.1 hypothetical protein SAMN05661044_04410 [Olivibacter domesticus]